MAGVLEGALGRLFGENVKVTGAGRTDSGVHATGQVVSLTTESAFPFDRLLLALRGLLPDDLSVRDAAFVEAGFSARFSARERTYVYAISNRSQRSALLARYAAQMMVPLDLEAMREGAAHLTGSTTFARSRRPVPRIERSVGSPGSRLSRRVSSSASKYAPTASSVTWSGRLSERSSNAAPDGALPASCPQFSAGRDRAAAGATAPAAGLI